jgi:hypothetical protein
MREIGLHSPPSRGTTAEVVPPWVPPQTVGYCTGIVFTRRIAPLAGAGMLTLILPLTIWASGAPLATAITGVAVYRVLCFWLPLPSALAHLPALRETIRQARDNQAGRARQAPHLSAVRRRPQGRRYRPRCQ